MSWLFSRALVAEFSAATCSDGALSALSSGSPTPQAFLSPDRMTAFSRPSRFGMTFSPLTDDLGVEVLTWCQAASRARTSASLARGQESAASDPECGPTWRGWLAKYDPDSCSWRTAQQSLVEDSAECLETFPRWGMTRGGLLWEQPTLGLSTSEIASGLWPTPTVSGNYNRKGASKSSGDGLATAVKKWPTPTAVTDSGGAALCKWGGSRSREKLRTMVTPEELNGALNPTWVEWLMGWPLGWTDLRPLGTDKYPSAPPQPSAFSQPHLTEA